MSAVEFYCTIKRGVQKTVDEAIQELFITDLQNNLAEHNIELQKIIRQPLVAAVDLHLFR